MQTTVDNPQVDGYQMLALLASSDQCDVWTARADHLNHTVVLKIFKAASLDSRARQRFAAEAAIAGRLSDLDEVVGVHRSGFTAAGEPFIAMDYFNGGSLADALDSGSTLDAGSTPNGHGQLAGGRVFDQEQLVAVARFLAQGLGRAHARNVLHLDLKPANVLVRRDGRFGIADFGISRIQGALMPGSQTFFTPEFAASELWERQAPTPAADVYGVAATLYCLATGSPPFTQRPGEPMPAFWARVLSEPAAPLTHSDLDPALASLILAGLAKSAHERPALSQFLEVGPEFGQSGAQPGSESAAETTALPRSSAGGAPLMDHEPDAKPTSPSVSNPSGPNPISNTGDLFDTVVSGNSPKAGPPPGHTRPDLPTSHARPAPPKHPTRLVAVETVGEADGVDADDGAGKKRKRIWLVSAATAALMLIASGVAVVTLRPDSAPQGNQTGPLMALRPTNLLVTEVAGSAHVAWTDHGDGRFPWVVAAQSNLSDKPILVTPQDASQQQATAAVVDDIDPSTGYCFRVGLVVGAAETLVVWSDESTCLAGGMPPVDWPTQQSSVTGSA